MSIPVKTFEELKLSRQFLKAIAEQHWEQPTEIQVKAIPLSMAGHDLLGIAQTGTGKTAAFVLPILMKLKFSKPKGPFALILAPTRELILQIQEMSNALAVNTDLKIVALYGGVGPKTQIELLDQGVDLLLATPGRFMDLYLKGHILTKQIKTLVLDEADRMLDMGFLPQIRSILEVIPVKRQNLLFSATMSDQIIELSHDFLEFPQKVEITRQATAVETVDQELYYLPNMRSKLNFLEYLLKEERSLDRVIVFAKTKVTTENIYKYIKRKNLGETRAIHANKGQNTRINSMNAFKNGEVRILITTDVTARGIDVSDVTHVINFDVPLVYEDYVHRIGRTGRARKYGKAITFATDSEKYHIKNIEKIIREPIPLKNVPEEVEMVPTSADEHKAMARDIDLQKRREDPDFKGAFHEKKKQFSGESKKRNKKGNKRY